MTEPADRRASGDTFAASSRSPRRGSPLIQIPDVLVVDDDPLLLKAVEALLSKSGFRPVGCRTGASALRYAAQTPIAAALVDIHLPDMNGLELSQQLRQKLGPTPAIVILSGDNSMETIRALPEAGATYFFAKPVNADLLLSRLKEWTTRPPSAV